MINKVKCAIVLAASMAGFGSLSAEITVPVPEDHIKRSVDIVLGEFEVDANQRVYFVVKNALKGELVDGAKVLIDEKSNLALPRKKGGGVIALNREQFFEAITKKSWFRDRVILLGKCSNGRWDSHFFDWSVWPPGEESLKNKSLEKAIAFIKSKVTEK